jgi:cytoplasmic iron level regulating protein YaaA (DUF328/UPF0246 family)
MIILLSPSKAMDETTPTPMDDRSRPAFVKQAKTLANELSALDKPALQAMLGVSDKLADLNYDRFRKWSTGIKSGRQAIFTYSGDAYVGLDAFTLTTEDVRAAQDRLVILSGLYGALRPLDAIHPYRLEMGGRFCPSGHKSLLACWKEPITKYLRKRLKADSSPLILNLASKEYSNAVNLKALNVPVISPQFLEIRDGEKKMISSFAKKARGIMTRCAIQNGITSPSAITSFAEAGYSYCRDCSTPASPAFVR